MLKKGNSLKSTTGWKVPGNQRKFLDKFAAFKKFNPLDAENWYSVTCDEILRAGGAGLLEYCNGSHIQALVKLYPELILKKGNFLQSKEGWKSLGNQRKFFDTFATSNHFNPLDAENWYSVAYKEIVKAGGQRLLEYYNGSHIKALVKLYPELNLKKGNFFQSKEGWKAIRNQRNFFDAFATSKKFNPLDAKNWHSVTKNEIIRAGGSSLLQYYSGSHIKALVKLYPELMLKKENFLKSKS